MRSKVSTASPAQLTNIGGQAEMGPAIATPLLNGGAERE